MKAPISDNITELLTQWRDGSSAALEELVPLVYKELHRLAHHYMHKESLDHILQPTALIHEAYIRLVNIEMNWQSRGHFYAVAAQVMRRILVDLARRNQASKRGGPVPDVPLDAVELSQEPGIEMLILNDALGQLASFDSRKSKILELRIFGGLTISETADFLEISHATVERDLKLAKAWVSRRIRQDTSPSP